MNRLFKSLTLFVSIMFLLFLTACGDQNDQEGTEDSSKKEVIKIGTAPYDYEKPTVEITKKIAEEQGYEVEIVEGEIGFLYLELAERNIDIWPGVFLPTLHATYHEDFEGQYEQGNVIYQSKLSGLGVPEYSEIESIHDLKGNEHLFDHKIYGYEPGAGLMKRVENFIEEYDLDFELVSGTVPSLLSELDYALTHEEEILFLAWRPHPKFVKYDIRGLENLDDFFSRDYLQWGVSKDFADKAPEMYEFVNNYEMDVEVMEEFLYAMEEGEDVSDLVDEWMDENRSVLDEWLGNE